MKQLSYQFSDSEVVALAKEHFGIEVSAKGLDSYIDQNFLLKTESDERFVFKIYNYLELFDVIDFQHQMVECISKQLDDVEFPQAQKNVAGETTTVFETPDGQKRFARLLSFVEGKFWVDEKNQDRDFLLELGSFFGRLNKAAEGFDHPGSRRDINWDAKNTLRANEFIKHIEDAKRRALVEHFLLMFRLEVEPLLSELPKSVIHNDGNDYNVLMARDDSGKPRVSGLIDFGDAAYTSTVFEVAVVATYAAMDKEDPVAAMASVIEGYCRHRSLSDLEIQVIFHLVAGRLSYSVSSSAKKIKDEPENKYLLVSQKPAWALIEKLAKINPIFARSAFRKACGLGPKSGKSGLSVEEILVERQKALGPSLSVSYGKPLKMVGGFRQYLFDDQGGTYLDMVNNVCHVGHCHPTVVKAASKQMALLNTNTRYLHDRIVDYAKRLAATMPDPLSVCYFVCSGSEANELALRMARSHTGRRSVVVVDGAYHGNTSSIVDLSPYKFDGKGGEGARDYVQKVEMPDVYRGPYKADDPQAASKYAGHVKDAFDSARDAGKPAAMFICESLLGCGGQIVLPDGYFKEAQKHVRDAGAVFVADEVQVGFGRVGTHFWGFETQGVVPDIVTVGKPIGNGHPLAAVVTTAEIAKSFDNGMEYFNTFGGNPVSCSIGMAVLDVIEQEKLQQNALEVGAKLKADLEKLKPKYPLIGDVRGLGLFIGIELVKDHETLEPAIEEANEIVERVKRMNILLSTDGPLHNVLKLKPPIVFTQEDADRFVSALDTAFSEI